MDDDSTTSEVDMQQCSRVTKHVVLIKRDTFLAFTLVDIGCRVLDKMWYGECDCCAEIIVWKEGNMADCSF